MSRIVIVELDIKTIEIRLVFFVDPPYQLFGVYAGAAGTYHNGRAMRIVGAEVQALVAANLLKPHPDIGLEILYQMPYMDRTVCIRQG